MNYSDSMSKLADLRARIAAMREEMRSLQSTIEPEPVADYAFATQSGEVRLSELFGDKRDLFVVHNMGATCPYCTLWADGYNGVYNHLAHRAAFVVASPDEPAAQAGFATARGWRFPMVSDPGSSFATSMGYVNEEGLSLPGLSVFQQRDGQVVRVSAVGSYPLDDLCVFWHLLELLPQGAAGWAPQISYEAPPAAPPRCASRRSA